MVEKKYRTVGVTYKLNENILEPKDSYTGSKVNRINSLLPEKLLEDPDHVYIIRQLAAEGELTTQNLQKALKMPFKAAVIIAKNLESLGLVTLSELTGAPPDQSWRIEDDFKKLAMMQKERIVKDLYEEKEHYNELTKWLKTSKGKDWLDFQADEKGWLHTPDGKTWLNSSNGKTWLKTTEAGAKYKQFSKNIEEQPKLTRENIQIDTPKDKTVKLIERPPPHKNYMLSEIKRELKNSNLDTGFNLIKGIINQLPARYRDDSSFTSVIETLWDGYEISVDKLQRNNPYIREGVNELRTSKTASDIIDILKNLDIIENKTHTTTTTWSGSQGRIEIENPNSLLFDRNPFVQKISSTS